MDNCQRQNRRATNYWLLDRSLRAAKFLAVITLHCLVKRRDSVTPPAPKRAGVATMRVRSLALLAPRFSAPRSLILAHVMRTAPSSRSLTPHVRCIHFNIVCFTSSFCSGQDNFPLRHTSTASLAAKRRLAWTILDITRLFATTESASKIVNHKVAQMDHLWCLRLLKTFQPLPSS